MLLNYATTYLEEAIIQYYASNMILHINLDAAFLVQKNAGSRYAGHYFLSDMPLNAPTKPKPRHNGLILTVCKKLQGIMHLAAKCETSGVFSDGQATIICRTALHALGHPQPPTPLKTNNTTAHSLVHANVCQCRSTTWDMCWNWLCSPAAKQQLLIYWDWGKNNRSDYLQNIIL
jgi:hypothetical protein